MFLKMDFNILNSKILHQLCKLKKISNYSKLNKKCLVNELNKYFAIKIIQKQFRKHFYKNAVDHITLEKVEYPCFIFRTKIGKCYFYNYDSIIKYIMKTGNCSDPMTRIIYSDDQLIQLDLDAKKHFPNNNYKSTYKIKKNLNYARRIRNRENEIISFQMRIDELKDIILHIIESQIFLWNISEEPILIDNIQYNNINSYINSILHEFKLIIINLRSYDLNLAEYLKKNIIESIILLNSENNISILENIRSI